MACCLFSRVGKSQCVWHDCQTYDEGWWFEMRMDGCLNDGARPPRLGLLFACERGRKRA